MKPEQFRKRFFEGVTRYRWLETLGRGGVGIVYKAHDLDLDEIVAIKVLAPEIERDEHALLARFKRELNLNRKIKHPNVARMFDYGISGDYPFITMEFVPGKDLWTVIDEHGRLTPGRVIPILRQVARGSHAVHSLGIVHRDLKSQNIIVNDDGAVAILDFGLARGRANDGFTLRSTLLGTPHYMSPEQALGQPVDARSDIYSIGCIAFEALTGHVPFMADSPIAVAMKHVTDPIPDDLTHFSDISPELYAIVMKTLAKDPDLRHANAADLEMELALLERTIELPAEEPPREARSPTSDTLLEALESALSSIILPLRAPRTPAARPKSVPPSFSTPKPTASSALRRQPLVLVANDDVRQLLKWATSLIQVGCKTLEVRSGQEALETLLQKPVDLVLVDETLPDISGLDVLRLVKSQPTYAALPVILAISDRDRTEIALGIESGAADVLHKPFGPGVLSQGVWRVLFHIGFALPADPTVRRPKPGPRARRRSLS